MTPTSSSAPLPDLRADLLTRHAAARRSRNAAPLDSPEFVAACEEVARIEVEIARLERAARPPLG